MSDRAAIAARKANVVCQLIRAKFAVLTCIDEVAAA